MRILVIDDDGEVREMICKMLTNEGHEVIEAVNGKEGCDMVRSNSELDLVITDLIMPEKEGIETIRDLKANYPELKVLAISGGGKGNAQDYLYIAKGIGADSTLKKPFISQELLVAVQELFPDK